MRKQHLIRNIIAAKGESAYVVTAEDKVQRVDNADALCCFHGAGYPKTGTIVGSSSVFTYKTGSQYCTALYYYMGQRVSFLEAVEEESAKNSGTDFIVYDCTYDQPNEGYTVETRMELNNITAEEKCEAEEFIAELCAAFPEFNYLLEFCRIYGKYLCSEAGSDFKFFRESDKTYYEVIVDLLGQSGYHFQLHCCRKGPDMPFGIAFG